MTDPLVYLADVKNIAKQAGQAILDIYHAGDFAVFEKSDDSPVTTADFAANEVLMKALAKLTPNIPILSEEACDVSFRERRKWQQYWLLDPMDGTQEFVSRSGDFAVNVALIIAGVPSLGVVYWPTQDTWYYAVKDQGAFKQVGDKITRIYANQVNLTKPFRMAVSRVQDHAKVAQYIKGQHSYKTIALGSCSLKSCLIAEGGADCYLRLGPTGEWDTGACHCILREAGGDIIDSEFAELSYNQRETLSNPDFFVLGDPSVNWQSVIIPHKTERMLDDE
ncbi:3'(2'),5'-bisphosphate nucleotidase CysQ [Gayadomonas joobiniege]|uniref:3'(2'),5'-bisphosphate nucleotidase CysQ n=1 Tax=Gayadomonas joobiniege TaxID=1234606 RepID=UPI0003769796|nr:3'(2'),5'-bisphosphate nucleotidase CysQ [Gayadomonas joobiniege]